MKFWHWLIDTDGGLAARIGAGLLIFCMLALVDLRRRGRAATRWREYLFLLLCVVVAMAYGVLNDLITSSISWEYFCYGKELYPTIIHELPPDPVKLQLAASMVGMKATWTAGLIIGVAMLVANNPRRDRPQLEFKQLMRLLPLIAVFAIACAGVLGLAGYLRWLAAFSQDFADLIRWDVMRPNRFMMVFGIHLGGYIGGLISTVIAVVTILRRRTRLAAVFQKH